MAALRFGNRGMNQPVVDLRTQRCYITSQNHGFAVDQRTLPDGPDGAGKSFDGGNDLEILVIREMLLHDAVMMPKIL
jgi:carbamoylphosphate synthase small subunit